MSTIAEISWALDNEGFQHLVANFLKVIRERAATHELPAEFINSALLYTNALFYEGSPFYQGETRLQEAIALSEYESRLYAHACAAQWQYGLHEANGCDVRQMTQHWVLDSQMSQPCCWTLKVKTEFILVRFIVVFGGRALVERK